MKNIILLLFLFGTFNFCNAQSQDELAIRNAMNEQLNAWNSGNIDLFMHTYWQSDSLLFVGSTKPTYGWQTTLEHYKQAYPDTAAMGKLSFNLLQLKQLSPVYYFVMGEWHLKRSPGDLGGYFTLLFKKINDHWQIIVDHTS
jgi:ketosteroid isomerase-like protein